MRLDLVPCRRPPRGVGVPRRGTCHARGEGVFPVDQVLGVLPGVAGENGLWSRRHDWG